MPSTLGYGTDFDDAETITNGTYYETFADGDNKAFYKINCQAGDYLHVSISFALGANIDIALSLYDAFQHYVGNHTYDPGTEHVYESVTSNTFYFIYVKRNNPQTGTVDFTLKIEGSSAAISGFEIISLLVGVISAISIIYFHMKKKKSKNDI